MTACWRQQHHRRRWIWCTATSIRPKDGGGGSTDHVAWLGCYGSCYGTATMLLIVWMCRLWNVISFIFDRIFVRKYEEESVGNFATNFRVWIQFREFISDIYKAISGGRCYLDEALLCAAYRSCTYVCTSVLRYVSYIDKAILDFGMVKLS